MNLDPTAAYQVLQGDALEVLRTLPDEVAQVCLTSPPYYGLRDYGTGRWEGGAADCDHTRRNLDRDTSNGQQLETRGTQPNKAARASPMLGGTCPRCGAVRVDRQQGLESTPELYLEGMVQVFREVRRILRPDGVLWLNVGDSYAGSGRGGYRGAASGLQGGTEGQDLSRSAAQVVGRTAGGAREKNLLGIPWRMALALQADGWNLRADVVWHKPNPMPENVEDRPTKAHEYLFLLSKGPRYRYDAKAVAEVAVTADGDTPGTSGNKERKPATGRGCPQDGVAGNVPWTGTHRNRRSVWTIPLEPSLLPHYAMMPTKLAEPCILACAGIGDLVLDPYSGMGTTGVVALRAGARYVGVELSPENVAVSLRRLAPEVGLGFRA